MKAEVLGSGFGGSALCGWQLHSPQSTIKSSRMIAVMLESVVVVPVPCSCWILNPKQTCPGIPAAHHCRDLQVSQYVPRLRGYDF